MTTKQAQSINLTVNNYVNINYFPPNFDSWAGKKDFRSSYPQSDPSNLKHRESVKRTFSQLENVKPLEDLQEFKKSHLVEPQHHQPIITNQKLTDVYEEKLIRNEKISKGLVEERVVCDRDIGHILGYMLLIISFVIFFGFAFLFLATIVLEKNPFEDSNNSQIYYAFLVPLLLPVSIVAVYVNWVAMKFFRHC
jgi:phosphatidylinositol glycan anchor class Y biosynthesis protein